MTVKVSLLLCTVRSYPYADHAGWDAIGRVVEDLEQQINAPEFELVVVDGLPDRRLWTRDDAGSMLGLGGLFEISHVHPRPSPWVRMRKVAICAYRNTGIAAARGELIVNLDDCCRLPPNFVETYWRAWNEHRVAIGMTWPQRGDSRAPGRVELPGQVYGFGSYPRALAIELNGYDEAFDGGQGLEDSDWSTRLWYAGLHQGLVKLDGFDILPQTAHDSAAIDPERPIVKCCNCAWQAQRVKRSTRRANIAELWNPETLASLVGPCQHLHGTRCGHHFDRLECAFLSKGFATGLDPEAARVFDEPPVLDMERLTEERNPK